MCSHEHMSDSLHVPSIRAAIPVLGSISAGRAVPGNEVQEGCITVEMESVRLPKAGTTTFALRVRGHSMINAGIRDGDIVILEYREPSSGKIVAALIDGESTLKRYVLHQGRPYLKAENPRFSDLIPAQELVIQGVVVALLRLFS